MQMMNDKDFAKFCREMDEVFEKRNKGRVKRGKEPLSMDEFIKEVELDCKRTEKSAVIYYILPVVICALIMVLKKFDSVPAAVGFAAVELGVTYLVFISCYRFIKNGSDLKKRWAEQKKMRKE